MGVTNVASKTREKRTNGMTDWWQKSDVDIDE